MKLLDEKGIGTVWSICKEKFALVGHTHNYAGSGSPGGSANSAIGVVDYNQTGKTIQIGYSGTGITGDQIKYIAGYTDGSGNVNAKIKDVSKDALKAWLGLDLFVRNVDAVTGVTFSTNVNTNDIQLNVEKADGTVVNAVVPEATEFNDGIMSKEDKVKLNGIASGANNYTLPAATTDNLGGVRVSTSYCQYKNNPWPIYVNRDGKIYTDIRGLGDNGQNSISYIELTEENTTTRYSNKRITLFPNESYEQTIDLPTKSGTLALISDIPTKTSQLTNDSKFLTSADKYTLPTASASTLGGIKVTGYEVGDLWPITVNNNGVAHTSIAGLRRYSIDGTIRDISTKNNQYSTTYGPAMIQKKDTNQNKSFSLNLPSKSGTLALIDDIPDISDVYYLCKFNFVNSISECITGTINLLFVSASLTIDLSDLDNFEDGVIIFLAKINGSANVYVNHTSGAWFSDGVKRNEEYRRAIPTSASIVTVRNGTVYVLI